MVDYSMKKILFIVACSILTGCDRKHFPLLLSSSVNRSGPVTIVIAGQSNAVSNASPVGSVSGHVEVTDMRTLQQVKPTAWGPIDTSVSWTYLGDLIYGYFGREVRVFNQGRGSTSTAQWMDTASYSYLNDMLATIRREKPQFVLWIHGESDYLTRMSASDTEYNLKYMIDLIHGIDPNIIVFLALSGDADGSYTVPQVVAEQNVINSGKALKGADLQAIRLTGEDDVPGPYTGYHLSDRGYQMMAEQFFNAMRSFL